MSTQSPQIDLSNFPATHLNRVFHVGNPLQERDRSRVFLAAEGRGLSVSLCPSTWTGIARLPGETYTLERKDDTHGVFLDFRRLSDEQREALDAEAVRMGLLETRRVWVYEYYDDEMGCAMNTLYGSREEAIAEEVWDEGDEEEVSGVLDGLSEQDRWAATPVLEGIWREHYDQPCEMHRARVAAWEVVLERADVVDGIWWWNDFVHRLSAPSGSIFQSRLAQWSIRPFDDEEDWEYIDEGY